MDAVRFGVIGLRRGRSFVRMCGVVGGARVTALYDVDAARVEGAAAELGVQGFTDFEAFLAADIDAVIVASPLPFHARQAVEALRAGKHVLSEVTACHTLEDARALVDAARASDAIYMMAENYRYTGRDRVAQAAARCGAVRRGLLRGGGVSARLPGTVAR